MWWRCLHDYHHRAYDLDVCASGDHDDNRSEHDNVNELGLG